MVFSIHIIYYYNWLINVQIQKKKKVYPYVYNEIYFKIINIYFFKYIHTYI